MDDVAVTERVWSRLLQVRERQACTCCGDFSAGERAALALYGPLARRDLAPVTLAQIGQSLDGRVATMAGDARDVSGPDGLAHLHRLRALVDGVIIGVRTALHDIPRLTVRLCDGRNPARIILDPKGRLPNDAPVLDDDGARRIVVQGTDTARPKGVSVLKLALKDGQIAPQDILTHLHAEGLTHLLVEGGGITIAGFLEAGLLSRLQVSVTPLLIGAGPQGLTLANPSPRLADAIRPETRVFSLGSDVVFDCALTANARLAASPQH